MTNLFGGRIPAFSSYLIGWLCGPSIVDVSIASEFPVTQLFKQKDGTRRKQILLLQANGADYEQAQRRLMRAIKGDPTFDWKWIESMPTFSAQKQSWNEHMQRIQNVGVHGAPMGAPRGAPAFVIPGGNDKTPLHPIPPEWIKRPVPFAELAVLAQSAPRLAEFARSVMTGDEVWLYDSPEASWRALAGERGMLLVRSGYVVGQVILMLN